MSNTRVYVGNLPFTATNKEFEAFLRDSLGLAPREVKVITDRETGQGRGFGFVDFETPAAMTEAINILNDSVFGGRDLRADVAVERAPRGGSGGGNRGRQDGPPPQDDWGDDNKGRKSRRR